MSMRIAIVNDSEGHLLILSRILEEQSSHDIIWMAKNGEEALEKCLKDTPDIILMDLIMPVMNGIQATAEIMNQCPCAILIVTASVTGNTSMVFDAMGAGALDVVRTPMFGDPKMEHDTKVILQKINVIQNLVAPRVFSSKKYSEENLTTDLASNQIPLLVFGASTGGPAVLATILGQLPKNFPIPIVIIQHVDQYFAINFAEWLNKQCQLPVRIAKEGDVPIPGTVLIAGTNEHMKMDKHKRLIYADDDEENHYKPSVNVFFNSVTKHWDSRIIACLLTGMGRDGASGLLQVREQGGYTITQNKDSCAVYGMPKAADDIGASMHSLDPEEIAGFIIELLENNKMVEQV